MRQQQRLLPLGPDNTTAACPCTTQVSLLSYLVHYLHTHRDCCVLCGIPVFSGAYIVRNLQKADLVSHKCRGETTVVLRPNRFCILFPLGQCFPGAHMRQSHPYTKHLPKKRVYVPGNMLQKNMSPVACCHKQAQLQ